MGISFLEQFFVPLGGIGEVCAVYQAGTVRHSGSKGDMKEKETGLPDAAYGHCSAEGSVAPTETYDATHAHSALLAF